MEILQPPIVLALTAFEEVIPHASRENAVFMPLPRHVSKSTQPFQALLTQLLVYT